MYDSLAKDPNSLANLDQDLPNFAQHTVPIFSLPQVRCFINFMCNFIVFVVVRSGYGVKHGVQTNLNQE